MEIADTGGETSVVLFAKGSSQGRRVGGGGRRRRRGGGGGGGGWCLETVDLELVLLGQPTLDQQLADVLPLVALNKN